MFKCPNHNPECFINKFGCKCGGGGSETKIIQPTPPPQPSTADAIDAWVKSMPQVMQTQLEYAPQEAAQQVALAQQYAQPLGEAYRSAQEALYPETTALQEDLATQASEGMQEGVPDWMREQYRSDLSANLGTNVGSPIGADYTSTGLLQQSQDWRNYYRNLALSVSGRQPLAQPQQPGYTPHTSGFTPQSVMGFNAQTYGPYAAASSPIVTQQQKPNYASLVPDFGFGFGG